MTTKNSKPVRSENDDLILQDPLGDLPTMDTVEDAEYGIINCIRLINHIEETIEPHFEKNPNTLHELDGDEIDTIGLVISRLKAIAKENDCRELAEDVETFQRGLYLTKKNRETLSSGKPVNELGKDTAIYLLHSIQHDFIDLREHRDKLAATL